MNNFIYTNGNQQIRIASVPNTDAFTKLHWHMKAIGYKTVPGGSANITIHFNRIANWVTGWCPPSFADFMEGREGTTTPKEVFNSELTKAIAENKEN